MVFTVPVASRDKTNATFNARFRIASIASEVQLPTGFASDGEVEDQQFSITTLPVTLSSVNSRLTSGGLTVDWTTATETRNVGFRLYGRTKGEQDWQPLTTNLIPSKVIDSLEPQRYSATVSRSKISELLIEEWDTEGRTNRHGPFTVGKSQGFDAVADAKLIDWKGIHAENDRRLKSSQALDVSLMAAKPTAAAALLWVTAPGIQRVSFDELQTAGADFTGIALADLALTDNGVKQPRYIIDANNNGRFDRGDVVEFLGKPGASLYSPRNAYRLLVDRSRVQAVNSTSLDAKNAVPGIFADALTVEQQKAYSASAPGADPWYDEWLRAVNGPASLSRTFDLPGYAGGNGVLILKQWGVTNFPGDTPDHHLIVKVNGQEVDNTWFDGSIGATRTLALPAALLKASGNTLGLEAPRDTGYDYDIQALDSFTVQYPRHTQAANGAWQGAVTSAAKIQLTGFQGEVVAWTGAQRRIGNGSLFLQGQARWLAADSRAIQHPVIQAKLPVAAAEPKAKATTYLIISHPLFINSPALNDLVALQEGRGYETAVVDVNTLYAAYSDFEVSPNAISTYLKKVRPRFALLVGGDSYDYHDYLKLGSESFIPTWYAQTDDLIRFAPADVRYADYNGDGKPDVALGRLPARTVTELEQLVTKIQDAIPPTRAIFSVGLSDAGSRQFASISETYAAQLPSGWSDIQIAVDDLGLDNAKAALTRELNLPGALVSYLGHSSYAIWGLNPQTGILFRASEARLLNNATPHLITQWGCWNTYFVNPKQDTMANGMLFQTHGAAAVLGATALTDLGLLSGLGSEFFRQIGQQPTLGEVLLKAQQGYIQQNPSAASKLNGFVLLGDPAAEL